MQPAESPARRAMSRIVRFDCYEVDLDAGQLRRRGVRIKLREQSFQALAALLEHPGAIVTRDDLQRRLWRDDVFVDFENNLNAVISRLREALNDTAEHPRYIETVPKRGYRFLGTVSEPAPAVETAPARRARLVVLPFVNLSSDPAQDYISDGMTDEIITALASLAPAQVAVIARTTAMLYKGSRKDVAQIGRELGVDFVVEGALRQTGDQIAINVQIIEADDQTHLFARRYDAALRDIFNMQDRIAQDIAAHIPAIADQVRAGAIGVARGPRKLTRDLVAYNEYIQGRRFLDKTGKLQHFELAIQHLEKAIARDPEFALAYDALSEVYWYLGYSGGAPPRQAFSAGIAYALRAIEIDNTRAETHALLGQFHKIAEYNWGEVEREMALALRLDPDSLLVRTRYAISWLMPHGRVQEAAAELERALELDPLSLMMRMWLGIMRLLLRDFARAIEEGRKLLELDPDYTLAYFVMASGFSYLRKFEEALAAQRKAVELSNGAPMMLGWLGLILAASGQASEARDVLQRLHESAAQKYIPPCSIAWIHLGLREIDAAFQWLNRAVAECDQLLMPIKTYGFFDPLRSDPRYAVILRKMNLES
ncbi:MAG: winged helix-turn-helix domain-containing protein [Acidobacteriia bacterium]|nr:winged helix-turn-helix domain-containing protein [Terriglobia bacterium]